MSRLLFWVPDSFMIIAIAAIALGLMVGLIRRGRAFSLIALIVFLLVSGPFVDSLLSFLWNIVPIWVLILALPVILLAIIRAAFRLVLGREATDHMSGILAAEGILSAGRAILRLIQLPFRLLFGRH